MQVSSWIEASMGHRSIHIGKAMVWEQNSSVMV
jgi:hypothetical protein